MYNNYKNSEDQLERMKSLIGYGKNNEDKKNTGMLTPVLESKPVMGADGNNYSIVKECNKHYIMIAPPKETELIAEDFDYIGGYGNKKENEYNSYNEAYKQLKLKLYKINEECQQGSAYSVASTINQDTQSEWQINETKEMREAINRCKEIAENASKLININESRPRNINTNSLPEAPDSHPSEKERNSPFTDTAVAKGDKDFTTKQTNYQQAGNPFTTNGEVSSKDMQSDKKPTGKTDTTYSQKPKYAPENCIADKNPSGGVTIKVDESRKIRVSEEQVLAWNNNLNYMDTSKGTTVGSSAPYSKSIGKESNQNEANTDAIHEENNVVAHLSQDTNKPKPTTGEVGETKPYEEKVNESYYDDDDITADWDRQLQAMLRGDKKGRSAKKTAKQQINREKEQIAKDDEKVDARERDVRSEIEIDDCNQHCGNKHIKEEIIDPNNVDGMDGYDWDDLPYPEVEDGYQPVETNFEEETVSMNPMDDQFNLTTDEFSEQVMDSINRDVQNENELHAFGQHPAYQKPFMDLPPNKEVATMGAKEWDDDSVKSDKPYGTQIGPGTPFDEKVIDYLTDSIFKKMEEAKKRNFQKKA